MRSAGAFFISLKKYISSPFENFPCCYLLHSRFFLNFHPLTGIENTLDQDPQTVTTPQRSAFFFFPPTKITGCTLTS